MNKYFIDVIFHRKIIKSHFAYKHFIDIFEYELVSLKKT